MCKGIEDVAAIEIKEILGCPSTKKSGYVTFTVQNKEQIIEYSYLTQSSERVMELWAEFEFTKDPFEEINKILQKTSLPSGSYKVLSIRQGEHFFNSETIMHDVGHFLKEKGCMIEMKHPKNLLVVYIVGNVCLVGLDVCGIDLHKREYRIYTTASDIRAPLAYAMIRMSGFKRKEIMLDPFCNSGTICIEAALFVSRKSPRFYEKEKFSGGDLDKIDKSFKEGTSTIIAIDANHMNVMSTKKNAKIAGIVKEITFSRSDVEWMDIKFEKKSIHHIVSKLPDVRKDGNFKKMEKIFNEFFYNVEYVLKDKGTMVILSESIDFLFPFIEKYKFSIREKREVETGKEKRHLYVISKSSS